MALFTVIFEQIPFMRKTSFLFPLFLLYFNCNLSAQSIKNHAGSFHQSFEAGKFLRSWLIGGPLKAGSDSTRTPDISAQEKLFNNPDTSAGSLKWISLTSPTDVINLDSLFPSTDYAMAYAVCEITSGSDISALLGIGSDDAVRVTLNGKSVHENFIARGLNADDDVIPVELKKGSNKLVVQVQNMRGGWGFMARFLDREALTERIIKAAFTGNAEDIRMLQKAGADPLATGVTGVNAVQAAQIAGRKGAERLLNPSGKHVEVPSGNVLTDSLYASIGREQRPGIALLVAKKGAIIYERGYAYANIEAQKKITPLTKFRIGSITKQFTASAILQLQEEGKLNVKDKISKYFPGFPRGDEVTIHHLLTHTSGIHSYTNTDSFMRRVTSPVGEEQLFAEIKKYPYDFNPGEKYMYNNSGYFLLGYLVEKLTGKKLDAVFRERFFVPFKMSNTGMYDSQHKPSNEATGYTKTGNAYDTAIDWDMTWAAAAGALYSTVEDLSKWNNALYHGKVLKEESFKAAVTPVVLNNGSKPPGTDYGYGLAMGRYRGLEWIAHSGGLNGFISQLAWYPQEEMTVVMLTNQSPPELMLDPNRIAEFFAWQSMDSAETYEMTDVGNIDLTVYEGKFEISKGLAMDFTTEGHKIFIQVTGQQKYEMFPSKKDEFFLKVVEATIHFNRNEKGEVVSAHIEQGGFKATAPKIKTQ
jgi:CubicO group peptidase (beta-lactamase class C family)